MSVHTIGELPELEIHIISRFDELRTKRSMRIVHAMVIVDHGRIGVTYESRFAHFGDKPDKVLGTVEVDEAEVLAIFRVLQGIRALRVNIAEGRREVSTLDDIVLALRGGGDGGLLGRLQEDSMMNQRQLESLIAGARMGLVS